MRTKIFSLLIIVYLILNSLISYAEVLEINVAGDNNYPPYEFIDSKGQFKGFNVDIIKAIAKKKAIVINFEPKSWKNALEALENGSVDVIEGMTKSEERSEKFSFSNRIITNEQVIFVNKKTTYISDLDDLIGRKVSYQKGDISYEILKDRSDIEIVEFENQREAINALLNHKVSAFVGNKLTGIYNLQKYGHIEEVKIVGSVLRSTDYAIAVKKGNEELLEIINDGLREIKKDGTYEKIYKKWFGEGYVSISKYLRQIFVISLIILILLLLIAQIVVIINKKLKREVEKRTEEIEKNYRQSINIIEGVLSGIIAFDSENRVVLYNKSSEKILGISLYKGMDIEELKLLHGYNISIFDYNETIRESVSFFSKGSKKYIDYSYNPIIGPKSREGGILLLHDYTEEKFLQDAINHNDKINALGRLIAGITHEIKSPLNSMKSYLELLPSKYDSMEYIKNMENVFREEIGRLDEMVSNISDFTKLDVTKIEKFNLKQIINETVILFKVNLIKKKIVLENLIDSDIVLNANIQHFKQILINILQNAIDASNEGDLVIIRAYKQSGKVFVEIEDEGVGITKDIKDRLFSPFISSKESGNGLGLFITKKLVEINNGYIELESDVDKGTIVKLIFDDQNIS